MINATLLFVATADLIAIVLFHHHSETQLSFHKQLLQPYEHKEVKGDFKYITHSSIHSVNKLYMGHYIVFS